MTQVPDVQCSRASLDHGHAVSLEDSGGDGRQQRRRMPWAAAAAVVVASLLGQPALADEGLATGATSRFVLDPKATTVDATVTIDLRNTTPSQGDFFYFYDAFSVPVPAGAEKVRARSGGSSLSVSLKGTEDPSTKLATISFPNLLYGRSRTITLTYEVPGEKPRAKDSTRVGPGYASFAVYGVGDSGRNLGSQRHGRIQLAQRALEPPALKIEGCHRYADPRGVECCGLPAASAAMADSAADNAASQPASARAMASTAASTYRPSSPNSPSAACTNWMVASANAARSWAAAGAPTSRRHGKTATSARDGDIAGKRKAGTRPGGPPGLVWFPTSVGGRGRLTPARRGADVALSGAHWYTPVALRVQAALPRARPAGYARRAPTR